MYGGYGLIPRFRRNHLCSSTSIFEVLPHGYSLHTSLRDEDSNFNQRIQSPFTYQLVYLALVDRTGTESHRTD